MPEAQSTGSRRGLFSCLHSKCDDAASSSRSKSNGKGIKELLQDLIADLYMEAFDRLLLEGMGDKDAEKLSMAMRRGGVCVGLLDPVSNIILNTISNLPRDFQPKLPLRRSKRQRSQSQSQRQPEPDDDWSQTKRAQPDDGIWFSISSLSYYSLVRFLVSYFGCLTDQQAARYLHWASADLALAVQLVEHDLYAAAAPQPLDPASERTKAALERAVANVWHPAPDVLVRLHTSPLPQQLLRAAAPFLKPGGRKLTLDDVNTVVESMRYQETASLDLQVKLLPNGRQVVVYYRDFKPGEGRFTIETRPMNNNGGGFGVFTIMAERQGDHFASLRDNKSSISTLLEKAYETSQGLKSCGDDCEYTKSLKMRLHGTIHAIYLKVFTMLPSDVSCRLVRYILFAGHCYGPLGDPVSNIIVNSIWHSIVFPLPSSADSESQAYDILDTLSMLRVEVRSLKGLVALVQAANTDCSMQRAMEHLCSSCCHLSQEMHGFTTAAEAAQHPQHAALGSFLSSLMPDTLDNLQTLLSTTNGTLSSESLHRVECILINALRDSAVVFPPEESELCKVAKDTLLAKRAEYNGLRLFFRSELEKVLKKYASEHPEEPKYVPSVICGVVQTFFSDWDAYHVNFVAASESGDDNQLFFAELNVHQSKPSFCCRLHLTVAHTGRCYYGQTSSVKIMYPASSDYFQCDITGYGIGRTDRVLDADLVFDFRRDEQFAKDVVKYYQDLKAWSELDVV